MVWYSIQKVVPIQWIPNVSYTSNQTYENIFVKRKEMFFLNGNQEN